MFQLVQVRKSHFPVSTNCVATTKSVVSQLGVCRKCRDVLKDLAIGGQKTTIQDSDNQDVNALAENLDRTSLVCLYCAVQELKFLIL